jgi:5'-nucleotidase / UDP-sugar diphosphatase
MKKTLLFSVFLCFFILSHSQTERKITIIHTNDLHSRLNGYAPESAYTPLTINDDNTVGGFARLSSVIISEKGKADGTTLVVDGGDFLMGTLFQSLEEKTGFQLSLMKKMGYDVLCIGNHEFDYGPDRLAQIVYSSVSRGPIPYLLLSNAEFNAKDVNDDLLKKLYNEDIIKRKLVVLKDGLKFGFFSLMGKVADENAAFAPPVTFSKQISTAKKMVKELQNDGCDIIICLSHSGVYRNPDGKWEGEDVELAKKVKGINVIISGHTHTVLDKPVIINGIPIVQAGEYGQHIGKLTLIYNNSSVIVDGYSLIPVNDMIPGDPVIQQLIEDQKEKITSEILSPLGFDYDTPIAETDFILECNELGDIKGSNLGPMVADAIHSYVNNHSHQGTDISMVAVGVIRDRIVPGIQTAADIFRVMSMGRGNDNVPGYPLSRLYFTGKELKSILEILQVAYKSAPANYCYYSGLRVEYNPERGLMKKIRKIEIVKPGGDHMLVDFSKKNKDLYSITANSYMLEFIGIIKKMSFGLINVVPKDVNGNQVTDMSYAVIDMDEESEGLQEGKEWLALMELIGNMNDTNGNGIPEIDKKYSNPVKNFFEVK